MAAPKYIPCDLCGNPNPRFILNSPGLDGPLVQCVACGFRYVGVRRSQLAFGRQSAEDIAANVRLANRDFRNLRLEEEARLAQLNARWRLDLIRKAKPSGKLLEIGCARGDFLRLAREQFDACGVEPTSLSGRHGAASTSLPAFTSSSMSIRPAASSAPLLIG
jgi:hypothetical protein